eukprot:1559307-Karenia_brevis.AAC.1
MALEIILEPRGRSVLNNASDHISHIVSGKVKCKPKELSKQERNCSRTSMQSLCSTYEADNANC